MALTPGDKLGPYEIVEPIGKGGMGEVYRARDTRLGRDVAIKVSSKEFNERFEREARAISSLNHPNICTLHDVGSSPQVPGYLVMEFVEGETLSKILSRGPLPLDKALQYAGQITDALAAAHAKGIIHRDLKPGNIMVTPHGVKVLDFGLAKLGQVGQLSAEGSSEVATMTEPITQSGSIVGTLHYMSPEQVEGKDVDERSDIFAFGAVLYEMVTGQRAFDGDSKAAIMAAVMKDQPPSVRQVRNDAPRSLDRLIRKCLEKKPDDRWQTARDLKPTIEMIDLDAVSSGSMSGASGAPISSGSGSGLHAEPRRQWLVPALSVIALVVIGTLGWMLWNGSGEETVADAVQFELGAEGAANLSTTLAVSPDGRRLAFIATGVDGKTQLWIRTLETLEAHPLPGTEGAAGFPFWSWDSKSVVFTDGQSLRKIDAAGGPAQILAPTGSPVVGGFWTPEGKIVLTLLNQGIFEIPAGGGEFTRLGDGFFPSPLPDGQHFLYLGDGGIHIATLPEPEAAEDSLADSRIILPGEGNGVAMYSPAPRSEGYLLFQRPGTGSNGSFTLMAQPFDADALELLEAAVPVAENVPLAGFTVSNTGVLIYSTGALNLGSNLAAGSVGVLTWFDRSGVIQGTVGQSAFYDLGFRLSPDGTRVATSRDGDIWVTDLERGGTTKLTFSEDVQELTPIWSPDGTEIVYVGVPNATRRGYKKPANGAGDPELLYEFEDELPYFVGGWSRDKRYLLVYSTLPGDVYAFPLDAAGGDPKKARETFVQLTNLPDADERGARWSPNGRFFAYTSNETGRDEAFVRAFDPETGSLAPGKWMISTDGGVSPHWRADGREMYYLAADGNMMAVEVNTEGDFERQTPEVLFRVPVPGNFWDTSADGQQFLIPVPEGQSGQAPYRVVLNWTSTLK